MIEIATKYYVPKGPEECEAEETINRLLNAWSSADKKCKMLEIITEEIAGLKQETETTDTLGRTLTALDKANDLTFDLCCEREEAFWNYLVYLKDNVPDVFKSLTGDSLKGYDLQELMITAWDNNLKMIDWKKTGLYDTTEELLTEYFKIIAAVYKQRTRAMERGN